jgi:hypothetical protein
MTPRRRWAVISLAAITTGVAAWVGPEDKSVAEPALPVERAQAAPKPTVSSQPIDTQLPVRQEIGQQRGDPFAALTWTPVQTAAAAAKKEPPPKPQAPPNPYKFAGTVNHDGERKVFLMIGDHVIEVKAGEKLEHGYRVKSITADAVTLVYEQVPDQPVTIATVFPDVPPAAAPNAATGASAAPAAPPKH